MSIFQDAREGNLVGRKLDEYIKNTPNILDQQDSSTGLAPLATAVVAGYPEEVRQLLRKGAKADAVSRNGEGPLILASTKTTRERPLIIQLLLAKIPASLVDQRSPSPENKTALMYAIDNKDVESVRLLRNAGASVTITNDAGLTVEELAKNAKDQAITNALDPKGDKKNLAIMADIVMSVLLYIIAWVNNKLNDAVSLATNGLLNPAFDQGMDDQINPIEAADKDEFVTVIDNFVKDNPVLESFFKDKPDFIKSIAEKAGELAQDPETDLGDSDVLPKVIKVSMHQQVMYCDDSTSMKREGRWEAQKDLIGRITTITTRVLPEDKGVALRFINREVDNSLDLNLERIKNIMDPMPWQPGGDTEIGTYLRSKILQPLVYDKIRTRSLDRPLLVCISTDGMPEPEKKAELSEAILECGRELEKANYPRKSVMFMIGQIGTASSSTKFLNSLKDNAEIADVIFVTSERLDEKFAGLRANERELDRWLIELLFSPIQMAETNKDK